jgi:type I restriction enzyme, R subunit
MSNFDFIQTEFRIVPRKQLVALEQKLAEQNEATLKQQQAKLYADCLEQMYGQRPIIFYTNG